MIFVLTTSLLVKCLNTHLIKIYENVNGKFYIYNLIKAFENLSYAVYF